MSLFIMNKRTGKYEKSSGIKSPINPVKKSNLNLINARMLASKAQQNYKNASSFKGMAFNTLKAIPGAVAETAFKVPLKVGASIGDIPIRIGQKLGGQDGFGKNGGLKPFNFPGLGEIRTYQNEAGQRAENIVGGKQPLWHALKPFTEVPLDVAQTVGTLKGIGKLSGARNGRQAVSAVKEVVGIPEVPQFKKTPISSNYFGKDVFYRGIGKNAEQNSKKIILGNQFGEGLYASPNKNYASKYGDLHAVIPKKGSKFHEVDRVLNEEGVGQLYDRETGLPIEDAYRGLSEYLDKHDGDLGPAYADWAKSKGYDGIKIFDDSNGGKLNEVMMFDKNAHQTIPLNKSNQIFADKKQRGFVSTVKESPYTSPETKKLIKNADYTPQGNDVIIQEAHRQIKTDINSARDKALKGDDNQAVANAMELIKHYQNQGDHGMAADIASSVAEKLTEHGRAVQAASLYNKLTPAGIVRYAQKVASKSGHTINPDQAEELYRMALSANKAKGEDKAIQTFKMLDRVHEFIPSKLTDQIVTVWKVGLLSNLTTHLRNIIGTGGMTALETAKDIPATGLDMLASLFTGKRTKTLPSLNALGQGAWQGAKKAGTFLKTGVDLDNVLGKIDYKKVNLPPVLKQYTNVIFRTLGAEDKIFKEALLKKSLHEMAVVDGINKGLKGGSLSSHIRELYNNPTAEMVKKAVQESEYGTFNNSNVMSSGLNKVKQSENGFVRGATELVMPFGKTPANVAGRIFDYAPTGFAKAGYHAFNGGGQKQVVDDLSRAIVGSGAMYGGYQLGKNGMMTGNYPTDPTQRAMFEAQNLQPNALKLGGRTYSTNALSPVGNLLGMGSGIAGIENTAKPEQIVSQIAALGGQTLLNQTFLQGLSGAMNALTDPARSASTFANNAASGVIPSIIGSATKAIDPVMRQSNGMLEAIQAKTPFLSRGLLPKTDVLGQERMNNNGSIEGRLGQFYNPFTPKDVKDTPIADEIYRLQQNDAGVNFSHPSKQIGIQGYKVNLTPQEYTLLEKQTGGFINKALSNLMINPDYIRLSDEDKAKSINGIISKVRQVWGVTHIMGLDNSKEQLSQQFQKKLNLNKPYYKP